VISLESSLQNFEGMDGKTFQRFFAIFQKFNWIVPFEDRFKLFKHAQRLSVLNIGDETNVVYARIRRNFMIVDGLNVFNYMLRQNLNMRSKFRIVFIDINGNEEPGIDDGGPFKEFLLQVLKTLLNPEYGLYVPINGNELIPNPLANIYVDGSPDLYYFLLGVILARALQENILVSVNFHSTVLRNLLGKRNSFNQMISFDKDLFSQLKKVKDYENVEELCLYFTASDGTRDIELKPDGGNIQVDQFNKLEYIYLYSDYKLNRQFKTMNRPFLAGFSMVIDMEAIQIINEVELGMMISGVHKTLDTRDLENHTVYVAGYNRNDKYIKVDFFDFFYLTVG
jgi:hypothetical protein